MFLRPFPKFVFEGARITATIGNLTATATIMRDETDLGPPWERDCAFWPALDPAVPGYVALEHFEQAMREATAIALAWERDEWWYVGIAVEITADGTPLGGASLWGIECNYPGSENLYLLQVANELLPEALDEARYRLAQSAQLFGDQPAEARP
jgi:hypothetical protein